MKRNGMKFVGRVLVAVSCVLGAASASQAGIINGSFEDIGNQTFQSGTWGLFDEIPGWKAAPGSSKIEIGRGSVYGISGYHEENVLELDSTSNAVISQIVAVDGGLYDLSFLGARRNNVAGASATFDVFWNNVLVGSYTPSATSMALYTKTVTAQASNTLSFVGTGTSDSYGALIDNVQLTAVPDAGVTGLLFGMAVAGLAGLRRRMR